MTTTAAAASKISHEERTAAEPRDKSLHSVVIRKVDVINGRVRIFRLAVPREGPVIRFLPGQWLDVFVPGVSKAGGFTITSPPSKARWATPAPAPAPAPAPTPASSEAAGAGAGAGAASGGGTKDHGGDDEHAYAYLELAVQKSPDSPAAIWLWRGDGGGGEALLGGELGVRVGGGFVWPPAGVNVRALRKVVFVAGGVGVNPLMSMLSTIAEKPAAAPFEVEFLYSVRDPGPKGGARRAEDILFLERIASAFPAAPGEDAGAPGTKAIKGRLRLFLTPGGSEGGGEKGGKPESGDDENTITCECRDAGESSRQHRRLRFERRRITIDDVGDAVGESDSDRRFAVVYICGVPTMTDEFVDGLTDPAGKWRMERHRVLCEKWW